MSNKYIVLPRTKLEERIKELEETALIKLKNDDFDKYRQFVKEAILLKELLKEGTDGSEIFEAGRLLSNKSQMYSPDFYYKTFEDFNNIKEE